MSNDRKFVVEPAIVGGVLLLLAVIAYVLSIGPAWWLARNQFVSWEVYRTIYTPLLWCHNASPECGVALERYIELWRSP
jgi:hypothetical protein